MKEVLTIAGPTPDPEFIGTHPNAVREWCINTAVVDPATDSILANSEDGKLYRWDLTTNTFTQQVTLTTGVGEAYTPTLIGVDGTVYAINNATLFAVGDASASFLSPRHDDAGHLERDLRNRRLQHHRRSSQLSLVTPRSAPSGTVDLHLERQHHRRPRPARRPIPARPTASPPAGMRQLSSPSTSI